MGGQNLNNDFKKAIDKTNRMVVSEFRSTILFGNEDNNSLVNTFQVCFSIKKILKETTEISINSVPLFIEES